MGGKGSVRNNINSVNKTYTIHCKIFKVAGETFVNPDIIPPSAGNKVTEPFVC